MMRRQFPDRIRIHISKLVHFFQCRNITVFEHLHKFYKDFRRCPRIVYSAVMIFQ